MISICWSLHLHEQIQQKVVNLNQLLPSYKIYNDRFSVEKFFDSVILKFRPTFQNNYDIIFLRLHFHFFSPIEFSYVYEQSNQLYKSSKKKKQSFSLKTKSLESLFNKIHWVLKNFAFSTSSFSIHACLDAFMFVDSFFYDRLWQNFWNSTCC